MAHVKQIKKKLLEELRRSIMGYAGTAEGMQMFGPKCHIVVDTEKNTIRVDVHAADAFGIEIKIKDT